MHKSFTISTALDWFGINVNETFFLNSVLFLDGKCRPENHPSLLLSWKPRGLIEPKTRIYETNKNILLHVVFLSTRVHVILSFILKLHNPETSLSFTRALGYFFVCFFFC